MVERILALIKYLGLSHSQFADEIGVQRSAMSHLVSGRNNPSLEFILKVLKRFPEINTDWLLTGTGSMASSELPAHPVPIQAPELFNELPEASPVRDETEIPYEKPRPRKPSVTKKEPLGEKEIERIIVIYNDHTFRELLPE
jgi:transcriptional regulator with XRE-family HTH domain